MTVFGRLPNGHDIDALDIAGHGLTVTVLTYGAILQNVRLDGIDHSLTVGSNRMQDYLDGMAYHGAIVGPVANRITGARAVVGGIEHMLDPNLDRKHTLHGGRRATHNRIWKVADHGDTHLELVMHALFEISKGPALTLTITTTTDAPTLINATNHSYWCLDGSGQMGDHELQIFADQYLPVDDASFPTGEIATVKGTPFDFQDMLPLKLGDTHFDNTYCLSDGRGPLTDCLILRTKAVTMTVATTETGIHIYDNAPDYAGLAIEAQSWPDAPHHPHFPSILATPDMPTVQVTQWKFALN